MKIIIPKNVLLIFQNTMKREEILNIPEKRNV